MESYVHELIGKLKRLELRELAPSHEVMIDVYSSKQKTCKDLVTLLHGEVRFEAELRDEDHMSYIFS